LDHSATHASGQQGADPFELVEKGDMVNVTWQYGTRRENHATTIRDVCRYRFDCVRMSLARIARSKNQLGSDLNPFTGTLGQDCTVITFLQLIKSFQRI
jgi:hypothetical protein